MVSFVVFKKFWCNILCILCVCLLYTVTTYLHELLHDPMIHGQTMQSISYSLVFLVAIIWPITQFSYQHSSQHHRMQQVTKMCQIFFFNFIILCNSHSKKCLAPIWNVTYFSSMTYSISTSFNELTFNGGYTSGNGFDRLE